MESEDHDLLGRRSLLTKVSAAAVAGLAVSATAACAQASPPPAGFEPARHDLDSWLGELQGSHRVFIDSSTAPGGANALRYANNILTAHEDDYSGDVADVAMVVCYRHASTPYAFDDAIWAKYGGSFSPAADPAPATNPMNEPTGSNGGNSIGSLVAKGVQFAICSRATRSYAGQLARRAGVPTEEVLEELLAGAIPSSRFVPAGVMTVTRAQEHGYGLLYAQ
jgi:intracellular sulfur oxidation DsrE/DsrF family protein